MYECTFAGEEERSASSFCPVCLRKLLWCTGQTLEEHCSAQREACSAAARSSSRTPPDTNPTP
jgi:hypothetical protein